MAAVDMDHSVNESFTRNMEGDPEMMRNDTDILNLEDDEENISARGNGSGSTSASQSADRQAYGFFGDGSPSESNELDQLSDEEQEPMSGILDEDTIEDCLSNIGRTADGTQQVFLDLYAPGYSLHDISLLNEYVHLQKVAMPTNELTELSPLSSMPFLLELDVSNNKLTELLDFTPPKNLQIVDFSYNQIGSMVDLSAHHFLTRLVIDYNNITSIEGLEQCCRLRHLSLAHNQIETIQGLTNLPIRHLDLSHNKITKIENLETLKMLQYINLSGNQVTSMAGLQDHDYLESIDLEQNEITELAEVQHIRQLKLLRDLNLQRNPVCEQPDYRLSILFYLQQVTELDVSKVDVEEKVAASNMFNPPMEVLAARDHIMHVVYSFLQPSRVLDSTLPSIETPYPMLVLVGPQGSGKAELGKKLVEEFSEYFGYGVAHTTRRPVVDETPGKDFHFCSLEDFEELIKMGKFLYTYSYHGDLYGLTLDDVESIAREGLACVVSMEIEGVLTLKNTYLEPRYVLMLPSSAETHESRIRQQGQFNEAQVQMTLGRHPLYTTYHKDHIGFFDMMIDTDDLVDAFRQLRRLVMEYLGINAATPSVSEMDPSAGSMLDKENTMDSLIGGQSNLVRQWSKHSMADSLSQAISNLKVRSAPSPMPTSGRGIVEEQSLQRRQSAARQTASAHKPTKYEELLQLAPHTVPMTTADQVGLGDVPPGEQRTYSAPTGQGNMDALPPSSPDSSVSGSGSDSDLSNISEAHDMDPDVATPDGSTEKDSVEQNLGLPSEALDMMELLSGSGGSKHLSGSVPLAPRPGSGSPPRLEGSRPGSVTSDRANSRLGSERHRVLPPIIVAQ